MSAPPDASGEMEEVTQPDAGSESSNNRGTIDGAPSATAPSTEATGAPTAARSTPATTPTTLHSRLAAMSVSPPRQRETDDNAQSWRASTPPPPRAGSRTATPVQQQRDSSPSVGGGTPPLPRTHSSPSLLDASPKPPRSRGRSPRDTSPTSSGAGAPSFLRAVVAPGGAQGTYLQHELTPIARNTSEGPSQFVEDALDHVVVSPEDQFLHGEHLALPSNEALHPPSQPPLQRRPPNGTTTADSSSPPSATTGAPPYLPDSVRAKSVGNLDAQITQRLQMGDVDYSWDEDEENMGAAIGEPIQFPPRKFYTFTSREQYENALSEQERRGSAFHPPAAAAAAGGAVSWTSTAGLKPYQPTRDDLQGVGTLPREELSQIFISRSKKTPREQGSSSEEGSRSSSLRNTIALEERQWSIPSIRLANHVNTSTNSYTDEEDDLFRGYDDDASLSSRGSSIYFPEEAAVSEKMSTEQGTTLRLGPGLSAATSFPPSQQHHHHHTPVVIEDGLDRVVHPAISDLNEASAMAVAGSMAADDDGDEEDDDDDKEVEEARVTTQRRKKRSKKHDDKERQAYEWLRTVELGPEQTVIGEAASSKFLTGGVPLSGGGRTSSPFAPPAAATTSASVPLNRTESTPPPTTGNC